jgi:hypothetical protein
MDQTTSLFSQTTPLEHVALDLLTQQDMARIPLQALLNVHALIPLTTLHSIPSYERHSMIGKIGTEVKTLPLTT